MGFAQNRFEGADLPDVGTEQHVAECRAAAHPGQRQQQHHPVDAVGGAPVERLPERPEILLAVVIGRRQAGRLKRRRFGGNRAPFVGGPWWDLLSALRRWLPAAWPKRPAFPGCFRAPIRRRPAKSALRDLPSTPLCRDRHRRSVRSKSSACSSSFATSLSRFLVVVGFCAMRPLPCTVAREAETRPTTYPHTRLILHRPYRCPYRSGTAR